MFHVAKTSGVVRRVKTIIRVFSSTENLIPALFSIPCLTNLMISCLLVGITDDGVLGLAITTTWDKRDLFTGFKCKGGLQLHERGV
jgi:hypothetical protein